MAPHHQPLLDEDSVGIESARAQKSVRKLKQLNTAQTLHILQANAAVISALYALDIA